MPPDVKSRFEALTEDVRSQCLELRRLTLEVASQDPVIGSLTETLKWGEPSYLTEKSKSGSTLRIWRTKNGNLPALFVNCQTSLIDTFRQHYPAAFTYEGNRGVVLTRDVSERFAELQHCIHLTLTYHLWK